MDFTVSPRIEEFRSRIAAFVDQKILPLEADPANYDAHENIRLDTADELRSQARAQGLWCLQLREETGGQGFGKIGMAVKNLRFTMSLVKALQNVSGVGSSLEVAGALFDGEVICPALRIDNFRFTSATDF